MQWEVNTGSGTFTAVTDTGVYSGSSTDTLTITDPTSTMNGYKYEAVFTNSVSSATSSAAALTVETATAPSVTTQPTAQTARPRGTATFTAAASGIPTPTVQWEVNTGSGSFAAVSDTGVYSGSTTDALTITDPTLTMNGYQYEAVFTNSVSSATSSAAAADGRDRDRPQRDHAAHRPDGADQQHGNLHGGGQRHSQSHGAVGSQHRQRQLHRRDRQGCL